VPVPGEGEAVRNANAGNSQSREGSGDGAKKVLVTGAAGAVGAYVVQLARLAGLHVTAATSSNARNDGFLRDIGASECVEYFALRDDEHQDAYDIVIDTVGGQPLVDAWKCVRNDDGCLVSVDSSSYNFLEEHAKRGITRDGVKALFFIVQGSQGSLGTLARWAGLGLLRVFVLDTYPLEKAQEAYERANGRLTGRGKIVLSS
jgi:NADPH:quinone reductase-like Zn-dependent oxidoreductase